MLQVGLLHVVVHLGVARRRDVGMPEADEEYDADRVGLVALPDLVLPRIIKDQELTLFVRSLLVTASDRATGWAEERQVASEPRVRRATMRLEVCAAAER